MNRWAGLGITALIAVGVGAVLWSNLEPPGPGRAESRGPVPASAPAPVLTGPVGGFREYLIGDPEEREGERLEVSPVWFPAVAMDAMPSPEGADVVHLEADVKATANNPNGFALGEFIPYLKIAYAIAPEAGGEPITGELLPMVARDGLHYGANVALPGPGRYRLTYRLEPPSAGGLGRHADPVTGVGPWWEPFEVSWDWDYRRAEGP